MILTLIVLAAIGVVLFAERSAEHLLLAIAAFCFGTTVLLFVVADFERAVLLSSILAAAIFSFLASWDEVVISIFMASPELQTLPVRMWTSLRTDLSPTIAAISTILVASSVIAMALLGLVAARNDKNRLEGEK